MCAYKQFFQYWLVLGEQKGNKMNFDQFLRYIFYNTSNDIKLSWRSFDWYGLRSVADLRYQQKFGLYSFNLVFEDSITVLGLGRTDA